MAICTIPGAEWTKVEEIRSLVWESVSNYLCTNYLVCVCRSTYPSFYFGFKLLILSLKYYYVDSYSVSTSRLA